MSAEDELAARQRITEVVESDEIVRFDVERFAQIEWDEDPAPGRPEMTGQWRLSYSDRTAEEIDRQLGDVEGAVDEAKRLIAKS